MIFPKTLSELSARGWRKPKYPWTRQNPFGFEGRLIFFHIVAVCENCEGD
jgi:hypothetical protein